MLTDFLSNRTNLIILQCLLYFVVGYMIGPFLSWGQLAVVMIMLFLIQFITHIKAISDGMVIRQMMIDNDIENDIIDKIKKDIDKQELN